MENQTKKLIYRKVKDVAAILNCDPTTVRRLAKDEKIEHLKIGNEYRFTDSQIKDYINKNTIKPTTLPEFEL